ncbi:MAG: TetR/AcrR family transcriptional regulator [Polyangiaceae bacterium]
MPRTGLTAAEIRERAIDATMVTMREHGFDRVRLTDIAKQLGVTHAALYLHFADKSALLDAVSDRWLVEIDAKLQAISEKPGEPTDRLRAWMIALHRAKRAKVLHDPELYKSFDLQARADKPYVQRHFTVVRAQLRKLVEEGIARRRLRRADPDVMVDVLWQSTMAFHHPKLVAQHIDEKREPLLKTVLACVLKGLGLDTA